MHEGCMRGLAVRTSRSGRLRRVRGGGKRSDGRFGVMALVLICPFSQDPRLKHLDEAFEESREHEYGPEYRTAQSLNIHFDFEHR